MQRSTWMVIGLGVGLCLASAGARAATMLALDLPQLVELSEYVVVAKAESQSARKVEPHGLIVTDVRLRVSRALKGATRPGDALTVTVLGGALGQVGLRVPGEASFPKDQSVLVFVRREASTGELAVTGMSQGVMRIEGSGDGALVMPGAVDAQLVQPCEGALRPAPDALLHPQPLTRMLGEIERIRSTPAR
jgi:hypothetical protein